MRAAAPAPLPASSGEARLPAAWRHYRVYGLVLASELPFPHLLPGEPGPEADLELRLGSLADLRPGELAGSGEPVFAHRPDGRLALSVHRSGERFLLRYAERVSYLVEPGRVTCFRGPGCDDDLARHLFLSLVASLALNRMGRLSLHAAAVQAGDQAVAFLAPAGGGKSSLAAHFVAAGHALLGEDLLPLELRGREVWGLPGPPQLRLWPDSAGRLWGDPAALPRHALRTEKRQVWLAPGDHRWQSEPLRLRALFLLEPGAAGVSVERVAAREAALALVGSVFGGFLLDGETLARQLAFLAQVVQAVPVRRLRVPAGFDRLPEVRAAVLAHLEAGR